jgi:hypothetical protein
MGMSVQFHSPATLPTEKHPRYEFHERLGEPQSQSWLCAKDDNPIVIYLILDKSGSMYSSLEYSVVKRTLKYFRIWHIFSEKYTIF